ncbi:hypothetical protein MKX03_018936 [Papaver bracteatum]|nr:hypothetical protein MKX03_018936 [Papaver bracteatum]
MKQDFDTQSTSEVPSSAQVSQELQGDSISKYGSSNDSRKVSRVVVHIEAGVLCIDVVGA